MRQYYRLPHQVKMNASVMIMSFPFSPNDNDTQYTEQKQNTNNVIHQHCFLQKSTFSFKKVSLFLLYKYIDFIQV